MSDDSVHFRHIMLFFFKKGKNAAQTARKIRAVYGGDSIADSTVQKWFSRFRSGDFSLEDQPRAGRSSTLDIKDIMPVIANNPRITVREIAEELRACKSTVFDHLKKAGYVCRYDVWVPHELSERNLNERISCCDLLLKKNVKDPFLKRVVTGDEKWILYINTSRKKSWGLPGTTPLATPKAGLHPRKVMLSVWWDWKGLIHFELLPRNQTINTDFYCAQLDRLKAAIEEKRPELANRKGVLFHQDNARPHVSLKTRQKLLSFRWEVLPHPPYSPDIAPSDFHLFRSLENFLQGKSYSSEDDVKTDLLLFFRSKDSDFWKKGIMDLPSRWERVIANGGNYFVD